MIQVAGVSALRRAYIGEKEYRGREYYNRRPTITNVEDRSRSDHFLTAVARKRAIMLSAVYRATIMKRAVGSLAQGELEPGTTTPVYKKQRQDTK